MDRVCNTRLLKNARFLQGSKVGYFPRAEPIDGFPSLASAESLRRLDQIRHDEIQSEQLARVLAKHRPPSAQTKLAAPLFSGTLRFIQTTFDASGRPLAISSKDLATAMKYTAVAVVPIGAYCSQYGTNSLAVAYPPIPFSVRVPGAKYNDTMLSGWVDELAKAHGWGPDSCLVFLNPEGVLNTDAEATAGVLGYHSVAPTGIPYAFVNVTGSGLTVEDNQDSYSLALSHEIAEMTVDPKADGSNPEVCDECAGNCGVDFRNYFASNGDWLGGSAQPGYGFFIDGIASPASVTSCPAPASSCIYPPPQRAA